MTDPEKLYEVLGRTRVERVKEPWWETVPRIAALVALAVGLVVVFFLLWGGVL